MQFLHVHPKTIDKHAPILRKLYSFGTVEFTSRLIILGVGTFVLTSILGHKYLIIWYFLYLAVNAVAALTARLLAERKTVLLYHLHTASDLVTTATFIWMPIYLWFQDDKILYFIGLVLLGGAILNSFTSRSQIKPLAVIDCITNSVAILTIGLTYTYFESSSADRWVGPFVSFATLLYYSIILRDIFMLHSAKEVMAERTMEAQKMEAVGRLTGGVAHDFNNILTVVMGNLELTREIDDPVEKEKLVDEAVVGARRATDLVAQLLAFSRQSQLRLETLAIAPFIQKFVAMNTRVLPANITVLQSVSENVYDIDIDRNQLENALLNMIINARDAMPNGGTISLKARNLVLRKGENPALEAGPYVVIDVIDTGSGIPHDILHRVFDPFFTTKEVGKGSGLGLSMAKGFAEQSGGTIVIQTEHKIGTMICIILPAIVPDAPGAPERHQIALSPSARLA